MERKRERYVESVIHRRHRNYQFRDHQALAENADWELTILNRGKRAMEVPENVRVWTGDIDNREAVEKLLEGQFFDVVADFIAFTPEQVKRDLGYFRGKCGQYFFIGTGSAYQKPLMSQ